MSYWRFAAMIATSIIVMFGLMYLNTYLPEHVFWSETRVYMAILMGAAMAIVMLAYMLSMYSSTALNAAIFSVAALVFAGSLWLVRSQATVGDLSFMRAMIPHHSIAIMTSGRAGLEDPRVRKLADEIIYAQDKEIAEMRYLIDEIETNGLATGAQDRPAAPPILRLEDALARAHVPVLDPGFLDEADIGRVFPEGAMCRFSYTSESPAALAIGRGETGIAALLRLGPGLVRLAAEPAGNPQEGLALNAPGIAVRVGAPDGSALEPQQGTWQAADMVFELEAGLNAGYRGFYRCDGPTD